MAISLLQGDILQVRIGCYTTDQAAINTIHYICKEPAGNTATDAEAAALINGAVRDLYHSLLGIGAYYRGVSVQRIGPGTKYVPALTIDPIEGAGTGGLLPKQTSGLITLTTDLAGPRYRGRIYVPFPAEGSSILDGAPSLVYTTDLEDLGEELVMERRVGDAVNGITIAPILYHRDLGTWTKITGSRYRSQWATQRRRGGFGRRNPRPF